jgi:hypothetical protein
MIIMVVSAIVACHPDAVKLAPLSDDEGGSNTRP